MKQKKIDKQTLKVNTNILQPVILEIDEEEKCQNQSKIERMSRGKYSGGFRDIPQSKSKINEIKDNKKSLYRPDNQSKLYTPSGIYDQLGMNRTGQKFDLPNKPPKIQNQSYSINQLQSKIALLKQERDQKNNSLLHVKPQGQYYNISDNASRFQEAVHVKSSLDTINLENIEAKLEAHRRKIRPVQEEYNARKGKAIPLDRYGYIQTNVDVEGEYAKLGNQENEGGKLYDLAKKKIDLQPEDVEFEELWEQKKLNNPKLAQYDAKYQQYLLEKDAKNIMGHTIRDKLFTWDKYTQPEHQKNRPKMKSKVHKDHSLSKSPKQATPSPRKQTNQYGPDGLMSIKDLKDVISTKDDKFIASFIFAQLDQNKVGVISKQQLHSYITTQEHIIRGYNIDVKWLYTDLQNFQTKRKGMFTKSELAIFLATLQKLEHPKLLLTSSDALNSSTAKEFSSKKKSNLISNFNKNRQIFEKLFEALDFNDDKIIKREQYIENIYIDSDCIKLLDETVIRIELIDKNITYRQILTYVLDDYRKQKNQKLKKSKQYLTFQRFCEYFELPESIDISRIDKNTHKKNMEKSTQAELYDLPEQYLQILKDIFDSIPRIYENYITSVDFAQTAIRDPQVLALSDQLCRLQSVDTRLPLETLGTTLQRIQKQSDQYSNWDTMKLFFSRRGRPLDWDYALIVKKRELRASKLKDERRSISKSKLRETEQYFELSSKLGNRSKQKLSKVPDRYTIPEPFDITDMKEKLDAKNTKKGQEEFQNLKKEFKARPVDQQILEPKPDLIRGQKSKKIQSQKQIPNYLKYENYENDRIERALKRAQQQHEQQQKLKQIKEKTKIKSSMIGIDLTKKYQEVIKEQQQKKKQNDRKKFNKTTQPQISEQLYPKDMKEENKKKLDKVKQKIEKVEEVNKRKKQLIEEEKSKIKEKNKIVEKTKVEAKNREKEEKQVRNKMQTDGYDFKPKINKTNMTEDEKQAIKKQKEERERKKRQNEEAFIKMKEENRKRILQQEFQAQTISIEGLSNEEILENIDLVDLADILSEKEDKEEYLKEFPNKGKTRKELKERQHGLAGRQRARMQKEEKKMMEQKRKYKEKLQKDRTSAKKDKHQFSRVSQKGEKSQNELKFHQSRALRRYRAIMQGKQPLSQYDKYSVQNNENA